MKTIKNSYDVWIVDYPDLLTAPRQMSNCPISAYVEQLKRIIFTTPGGIMSKKTHPEIAKPREFKLY